MDDHKLSIIPNSSRHVLLLFAGLSLLPYVVFVFSLLYAQHLVSECCKVTRTSLRLTWRTQPLVWRGPAAQ